MPPPASAFLNRRGFGIEVPVKTEGRMAAPNLADDFLAEEFDELRGLRMAAVHEGFHEKNVVISSRLDDRQRFGVIQRQGFFAEDVLAGCSGLETPLGV